MRNGGYFTHHDSKDRGLDFLRFLSTEQIKISGQDKNEIRKIYSTRYTTYRQQFRPDQPQVPFGMIVKALFTLGKVHLRENRLYPGAAPAEYINSHQHSPVRQTSKTSSQGSNQNKTFTSGQGNNSGATHDKSGKVTGYSHTKKGKAAKQPSPARNASASTTCQDHESPKRKRRNRRFKRKSASYRIAVDQHLMINKASSESGSTASLSSINSNQSAPFQVSGFKDFTRKVGNMYECVACLPKCTSKEEMERHLEGKRHRLGVMTFELRKRRYMFYSLSNKRLKTCILLHLICARLRNGPDCVKDIKVLSTCNLVSICMFFTLINP